MSYPCSAIYIQNILYKEYLLIWMPFHSLPVPKDVRQQPHYLRSHLYCWCDYDAIGMHKNVSIEHNIVFSWHAFPLVRSPY